MNARRILAWPSLLWLSFFILAPFGLVFAVSLARRGVYGQLEWGFYVSNYWSIFSLPVVKIFFRTMIMAGWTSLVCVGLGVLSAWAMAAVSRTWRDFFISLISVPFLTNGLIRILGLKSLVAVDGPVDQLLTFLHVAHDPFSLSANSTLVAIGLLSAYLPFAILPLYGAFEKFDFTLIEAAQDLGAGPVAICLRVVLPVLRKPILGAFFLVFVPCLGEYLIPDLLGGAKSLMLGNLITERFLKSRDWPAGSVLAVITLAGVFCGWAAARIFRKKAVQ